MDPPWGLRCVDPPNSTQQSMESDFYHHLSAWTWIAKGIKTNLASQEEFSSEIRQLCRTAPHVAEAIAAILSEELPSAPDRAVMPRPHIGGESTVPPEDPTILRELRIAQLRIQGYVEQVHDLRRECGYLGQQLATAIEEQSSGTDESDTDILDAPPVPVSWNPSALALDLDRTAVEHSMGSLNEKAAQILRSFEDRSTVRELTAQNTGVAAWILQEDSHRDLENMSSRLNGLGLQNLVLAMAAIALRDWIFAADYEGDCNHCVLLHHYRKILDGMEDRTHRTMLKLTQTAENDANKLDVAAHKSLFSSAYYRVKTVQPRLEKLGSQFSRHLALLVPRTCMDTPNANAVRDLFTEAMSLKNQLILSADRYVIVNFRPGSVFDGKYMHARSIHGGAITPEGVCEVKLCVSPAILVYPAQREGPVNYRLNVQTTVTEDDHHVASKGVVIV